MRANKGSKFEREISKRLSLWWTYGERDDVFWRSSQSGGRATQRAKFGKKTHGSYGDIAALDPIGEPLMKFATIELKCGGTHGSPWELYESIPPKKNAQKPFEKAITQAKRSAEQAESKGWVLIVKRDFKQPILYIDRWLHIKLGIPIAPYVNFSIPIRQKDGKPEVFKFTAFLLEDWLKKITPEQIINI